MLTTQGMLGVSLSGGMLVRLSHVDDCCVPASHLVYALHGGVAVKWSASELNVIYI